MGEAYSWEIREKAEDLYIFDGLTFEQLARETGVSVSQLKRWSDEGSWQERKNEHRKALTELKRKKFQLRLEAARRALESLDPQAMYAFSRIEAVAGRDDPKAGAREGAVQAVDRPALFLEDLQFVAEILRETDPEGLKILGRNFDTIVSRFKTRHNAQTA